MDPMNSLAMQAVNRTILYIVSAIFLAIFLPIGIGAWRQLRREEREKEKKENEVRKNE